MLIPLAPPASVVSRLPAAFAEIAARIGVNDAALRSELAAMGEHVLAKTTSRRILGVMNEVANLSDSYRDRRDPVDLVQLPLWLADVPCSPLYVSTISADRELAALLR